ncbi:MAG: 3-dehydroquinate synthase [Planctomycetota bacterium]|nr:3-dehydroquinate synthase [Planctomycetota bacterium]
MNALAALARTATGVLVVADRRVVELHGELLDAPHHLIDADERAKTVATWERVLDACVAQRLDRGALLVGYGGGMVLDVAGFAAASYLRGVDWVSVPTTLLAQVDAAHGGKTGVDHPAAKNLIGAFHLPRAVPLNPAYLATLPEREIAGGLAEVVKHGVIGLPSLLERAGRDDPATFVVEAAQVKIDIVARDPREQGERRLLNLGHTLGHAVERASDYELHHGEAVAIGLRAACRIAEAHCAFEDSAVVDDALDRCGLPRTAAVHPADVRAALVHDKKRHADRLRWVLPVALGDVRVFDDVPDALIAAAVGA